MHLQFVGCGDAFGSGGRFNTCFHLVGETTNILIDCGASSLIALKRLGIDRDAIDAIVVSHFHGDHFGGIPYFILDAQFARRTRPLTIAGPPGLEAWYARAMETAFEHSSNVARKFDTALVTLAEGRTATIGTLAVTPFAGVHGSSGGPFFALRIAAEGRVVTYSGDTEWTETLVEASRDADLFVTECYVYDAPSKNHMRYEVLAQNLDRLSAKRLVLTHMGENMLAHRADVPHLCAEDGLVVEL